MVLVHVLCIAIWFLSLFIALRIVWIGLSHFIFCFFFIIPHMFKFFSYWCTNIYYHYYKMCVQFTRPMNSLLLHLSSFTTIQPMNSLGHTRDTYTSTITTFHYNGKVKFMIFVDDSSTIEVLEQCLCAIDSFQLGSLHVSKDVIYDENNVTSSKYNVPTFGMHGKVWFVKCWFA
jgi:hypothetical protein